MDLLKVVSQGCCENFMELLTNMIDFSHDISKVLEK